MVIGAIVRAFRARNLDSALFVITFFFIVLYQATIGEAMWSGFPIIGDFLNNVIVFGASRANALVVALGISALGARILLGQESRVMA